MIPSIQDLTKEEKLQLMEVLWEDFTRTAEESGPPDWHATELEKREMEISQGLDTFTDWEQAKIELRRELE